MLAKFLVLPFLVISAVGIMCQSPPKSGTAGSLEVAAYSHTAKAFPSSRVTQGGHDELASTVTSMTVMAMPFLIVMILTVAEFSREMSVDLQKTSKDN